MTLFFLDPPFLVNYFYSILPVSTSPPAPRELKNDNSLNAFTLGYKRVGPYLGNYLFTVFCVLILIRIDPNLHIASKRIKLIRTNICKVLQFIKVMYQSIPSLTTPPPGQNPWAIFLMGEFPTPWARKEFKPPPPGLIKTS